MHPHSAARIISNTSRYTSIIPVLKKLHWLPVEHHSVFKTAILVDKFHHSGFPKYFAPYISSYSSSYITRHSQSGGNYLVIPKFQPSVHKSVKQFGYSLLLMLPLFGMLFLMRFFPLSGLLQQTPQNLPLHQSIPSLVLPLAFSMVLGLFSVPGY